MWVLIAVYNISKRYGDQLILDHISAEFHTGNIYCIVGENGSGKTVFLKCICGLISCSEGDIHIKGIPLRSENCLSGEIGAIIERPGFLPNYSGYENLYYLAALLHTPNKDQIRRAMYKVGLDPDSRKKVKHYSLGMKQRLGIAQAIMDNPAIMVLDEPFNGLDKASANDICNLLCSLKDQGKLIILAMHLSKDYADFYDQAYEIVSGKLKPYVLHGSKSII